MMSAIVCQVCLERVSGSSLINLRDVGQVSALLFIHMLDNHWELVERIRATTGQPPHVRMALVAQLNEEINR